MRSFRRGLAVSLVAVAPFLVWWTADAASRPDVDGVAEALAPDGVGRVLLVFGSHLSKVDSFQLRTSAGTYVAELPPTRRSGSLVVLALQSAPLAGEYFLDYYVGNRFRTAALRLGAIAPDGDHHHDARYPLRTELSSASGTVNAAENPVDWSRLKGVPEGVLALAAGPPDCPEPPGGGTPTAPLSISTSGQAIVATSGSTSASAGGIDSTASNGVGIAGHGDIGVLGDVDNAPDYGVRVGVLGSASSFSSIGVSGVNDGAGPAIQTGTGVLGRSHNGTGVYGITDAGVWSYEAGGPYYPTGAVGVKALAKGDFSTALSAEAQGANSTGLLVNHSGASGDVAVFQADAANCARIALDGTGYFNGGTFNSGADFAESVAVNAPAKDFEPGDVVAIDPASPRRFALCRTADSPLVAGVVSTRPAVVGTVHDMAKDGRAALADEVRVGIVGIVPTKVCDEGGPIRIGDLLVSASRPGHAKRAPERPAPGTVIGKALGALPEGVGSVEVLLMQR